MSSEIIQALARVVEDSLSSAPRQIAKAAKSLSLGFTIERSTLPADYLDNTESIDAYVAAFLLPNAVKVMHCLAQIETAGTDISVLDVGSGPGTAALAASAFLSTKLPDAGVRIMAIERSKSALEKARELFKKIAPSHHSFDSAIFDFTKKQIGDVLSNQRFDIIIAANVLNELTEDRAREISAQLIRYFLKDNGSLIIIDPALKNTARSLMQLRNRLVDDGVAMVSAPCLHQKTCPMLSANERDWCHFYIDWEPPDFLKELDQLAGMDHTHLKMSYMILQKAKTSPTVANQWRVVSSPLVSKGKRELVLCGDNGELLKMMRQDKDASETNEGFDRAMRGDTVNAPAHRRLTKEDSFVIKKRWDLPGT